ncbi:MAG TPA: response regulator [Microvirga sp.]|jgi:DNA-binding NtrC family response regulator
MPLVLIAEDEPIIRMLAADILEDDGFEVLEAATARAALAILEKRNGDVAALFTDVDMPGDMNGLELAGIVYSRWPHIAILVTSGVVRSLGVLPGSGVFLGKPYASTAPVRIIRELIQRIEAGERSGKLPSS